MKCNVEDEKWKLVVHKTLSNVESEEMDIHSVFLFFCEE